MWPRNPFDALPGGEAGVGGVLEYTLRSGASGAELALPGTGAPSGGPPMRFLVAMGAYWVVAVDVCVCVRRGKKLRGSHCQASGAAEPSLSVHHRSVCEHCCGLLCIWAESATGSSAQLPTCRFWNRTSSQWSSSGVLTLGIVRDQQGRAFLSCASTHLTAFTGTRGGGISSRFKLNVVHPIDDAGNITVRVPECIVRPTLGLMWED
jgi:hypothetical protein